MSQLVKDRFTRMLDSAIVVVGTKIIPALVFAKIGRNSAYIEHYYMHTPNTMILIVEPISKPWNRGYIPAWRGFSGNVALWIPVKNYCQKPGLVSSLPMQIST